MKRLPNLAKMLLLLVCFSFMLSAYNSGSTLNETIVIPYVELAPQMDGEMDEEWVFPPNGNFVYEAIDSIALADTVPTPLDHSTFWKAAYNGDGFYFWARVQDDSIFAGDETVHENDCFEIYFDGGDEDATGSYDANDVQWRYVYGLTEDSATWCDIGASGEIMWVEQDYGYTMELILPVDVMVKDEAQLFPLEPGTSIGFEVQTADNDNEGEGAVRECITKWWNEDGTSWQNPNLFGNALLGGDGALEDEMVGDFIEEVELAPILDGEQDAEWAAIPAVKMTVNENWAMADDWGYKDFQPYYKAAWNADGFYFYAHVVDDSIYVDTAANDYEQDCFEIYFDGDNSKNADYSDGNDVQWRWVYGLDSAHQGSGTPTCENEEHFWLETGDGYSFELMIPTSDLPFTPEEGAVIGFEVQCADNDTGARDVIAKWWNVDGNSWQDPGLFGTVELVGIGGSTAPGLPEVDAVEAADGDAAGINLAVPSVIASNAAVVEVSVPAGTAAKVSLVNIAGQVVKSAATNGEAVTLDVSDLANGVYLCNLKAGGESVTEKVTLIK